MSDTRQEIVTDLVRMSAIAQKYGYTELTDRVLASAAALDEFLVEVQGITNTIRQQMHELVDKLADEVLEDPSNE